MRVKKGVKKIIGKFSFLKVSVLLMCLSILIAVFVTIPTVKANPDEEPSKSFYMMGSAAASYYNEAQQPSSGGATALRNLRVGDAGGLLSYVDANTPGFIEYISSKISTAATSNTYKSMLNVSTGDGMTSSMYFYARYGYLLKSAGLDSTGKSGSPLRMAAGIPLWLVYQLAQAIPLLFVTILDVLSALNVFKLFANGFNAAITDGDILENNGKLMQMDQYGTGSDSTIFGLLDHVAGSLKDTYTAFYNLGWELTVPFSIVAIIAGIFLFRNDARTRNSKIKNLMLRVLMITFGIPILGGIYTEVLDSLKVCVLEGMNGTATVITCTLCDFEGWVEKGRLAVPARVELISKGNSGSLAGELDGESYANLRTICYEINKLTDPKLDTELTSVDKDWDSMALEKAKGTQNVNKDSTEKIVDLISRYMHGTTYESAAFESSTKAWITKKSKENAGYDAIAEEVINNSLKTGQFRSKDEDNEAEGDAKDAAGTRFYRMEDSAFKDTDNSKRWDLGSNNVSANFWNNGGLKVSSTKVSIYNSAAGNYTKVYKQAQVAGGSAVTTTDSKVVYEETQRLPVSGEATKSNNTSSSGSSEITNVAINEKDLFDKDVKIVYSSNYTKRKVTQKNKKIAIKDVDSAKDPNNILAEKDGANVNAKGGLSTMAMYNYLNSEFSESGVTMYSADRSTSLFTKPSHRSVNLIGGGAMSILYWLQAMITLLSVVILGFGYALPILGNSFKISLQIIYNMPFMMLGVIKSGVRVIVYTMTLIVEVLGTMFLYSIVLDIILALGDMTSTSFEDNTGTSSTILLGVFMDSSNGISFLKNTLTFTIIKMIFSMLVIIVLTIKALTVRGALVKSINELMEQALDRLFLNNNDSTGATGALYKPSGVGNMAKGLAMGAAKGAGQAAMNNYMNGGGNGMQKGPEAADAGANKDENGADNDEDSNVNVDNNDNIGIEQKDKEALPGSEDGKKGEDGKDKERLPGPTGGDGSNELPGPTDDGSPSGMNPSMNGNNGKNSESKDKKIANILQDANSLADVGTIDENGNFKPVNAMESENDAGRTETNSSTRPVDAMNNADTKSNTSAQDEYTTNSEKGSRSVQAAQNEQSSHNEYSTNSDSVDASHSTSIKNVKNHSEPNKEKKVSNKQSSHNEYSTNSDSVDASHSTSVKNVKSHSEINKGKKVSGKRPSHNEYNTNSDNVNVSGSHTTKKAKEHKEVSRKKFVNKNEGETKKNFTSPNLLSDIAKEKQK